MRCRICGYSNLNLILDLGYHPPSDAFLKTLNEPETYYPLRLVQCAKCGLAQLDYTVPKEELFKNDYPYETGNNSEGVKHFAELAKSTLDRYHLKSSDLVVDIGSNDGTLLSHFANMGCRVIGVEPVESIAQDAKARTINGFWDMEMAGTILQCLGSAKVITATNVLAHNDDLHEFMEAVDFLLADDGVFIVEAPSLDSLIDNLAYDTIYHEHLCYFSGDPLAYLVGIHGLNIVDTEFKEIHGGSTRYHISRGERTKTFARVFFEDFAHRVEIHRLDLRRMMPKGSTVVGVSAPAKGNTLLNYCGLDLKYVTDNSPGKIGRFTPGRHIPVYSDDRLLEEQPDYALLLAWNWKDQIKKNLSDFKGSWIIPLPELHIE